MTRTLRHLNGGVWGSADAPPHTQRRRGKPSQFKLGLVGLFRLARRPTFLIQIEKGLGILLASQACGKRVHVHVVGTIAKVLWGIGGTPKLRSAYDVFGLDTSVDQDIAHRTVQLYPRLFGHATKPSLGSARESLLPASRSTPHANQCR